MNNDLFLLIRQVRMPMRIMVPKQKKLPVFHKKACTIPDKIYSDKEIIELYYRKFIKIDIDEQIVLEIIQKDEDVKYKLMMIQSIEEINQIIINKIYDDYQLLSLDSKMKQIRQNMTNTLNDFTKDCEIKCLKHIQ